MNLKMASVYLLKYLNNLISMMIFNGCFIDKDHTEGRPGFVKPTMTNIKYK